MSKKQKTKKEIEAQLSLLYWLKAQPSPKAAIEKAITMLHDAQFNGHVKLEKDDMYDADFLEFWAIYPKKVGKGDAFRKWKQLKITKQKKEKILVSVHRHAKSDQWLKDDGKFIPNPATFLHQRRFDDEFQTTEEVEEEKAKPKFRYEHDKERNVMVQIPVEND